MRAHSLSPDTLANERPEISALVGVAREIFFWILFVTRGLVDGRRIIAMIAGNNHILDDD